MALTNDLIQQFVKATKDNSGKTSETVAYGTIVKSNDKTYVQLDGSTLYTPVSSTIVVKHGDRVMVTSKNHSLVVTGNLTDPSASSGDVDDVKENVNTRIDEFDIVLADKVSTDVLNAVEANINNLIATKATIQELEVVEGKIANLEADNVVINGTLEAHNGKFDSIDTTFINISGELHAASAKIDNLEATNAEFRFLEADYADFKRATIDKLEVDYATIEELHAERARIDQLDATKLTAEDAVIKNLQADVADIDTLIFGSASGTTIQTSFANAVIAQLGDAQIKSAMIKDITAAQITSGDINTNHIRVVSEDGKLVISDETIQISDNNRVRVQIGKDANDDYSINIWDANGELMFSESGITDNAIKEAIIRNDMVANNANISASKLDISSLFTEINGSTETIKSNRIYLDEQNQTLDLAFKEMSTSIENKADGETVTDLTTKYTTLQTSVDGINSTVGELQQTVESKADGSTVEKLETNYSELTQTVAGISSTVATHSTEIAGKADSKTVTEVVDRVSTLEQTSESIQLSVKSIKIGARNLIRNSEDLIFDGYGFSNTTVVTN